VPQRKSDGNKIGEPGVHYGKVFRMLYVGYSPERGMRFHVPVSQLYTNVPMAETYYPAPAVLKPVTRRRDFKTDGGVFNLMAGIAGCGGSNG
jgi:hypothetical protein